MTSKSYLLVLVLVCACIGMTMAMPSASFRGEGVMMPVNGPYPVKRAAPAHPAAEEEEPEEPEDSKKMGATGEPQIIPDANAKKELRNMVESLVRLVNDLRHNGTIRLPDPIERVFKTVIESMDTLQDDLNTDLDIDLGNLLNSGGK